MPIENENTGKKRPEDDSEKKALADAQAIIAAGKLKKIESELIIVLGEKLKIEDKVTKKSLELTAQEKKLKDAYKDTVTVLKDQVKEAEKVEKVQDRLKAAFSETAKKLDVYTESVGALTKAYGAYNTEIGTIVTQSKGFIEGVNSSKTAFKDMRTEVDNARQAILDFKKVQSDASKVGNSTGQTNQQKDIRDAYEKTTVAVTGSIEAMAKVEPLQDKLKVIFSDTAKKLDEYAGSVGGISKAYDDYNLKVDDVIGKTGGFVESIEKGKTAFGELYEAIDRTGKKIDDFKETWSKIAKLRLNTGQITDAVGQIEDAAEKLHEVLSKAGSAAGQAAQAPVAHPAVPTPAPTPPPTTTQSSASRQTIQTSTFYQTVKASVFHQTGQAPVTGAAAQPAAQPAQPVGAAAQAAAQPAQPGAAGAAAQPAAAAAAAAAVAGAKGAAALAQAMQTVDDANKKQVGSTTKLSQARAQAVIESEKLRQREFELIEAIKKQIVEQGELDQDTTVLTERFVKLTQAYNTATAATYENVRAMERQESSLNKVASGYKKGADGVNKFFGFFKEGLQTLNTYNLEMQEIVDLSGQFTGKFDQGIKAFEDMRSTLNLTRKEMVDFGKAASELGRRGLDIEKLTKTAENMQKVFGQTRGLEKFKSLAQMKVSDSELKKILEKRDVDAIIKAGLQRNVTLQQTYDMTGVTGVAKGKASGDAAKFERAGAKVKMVGENIETAMAAGLQMGLGPDIAGMVVPLAEMNVNVAKLVEQGAGFISWLKSAWPLLAKLGGAGAAGSAAGSAAAGAAAGAAAPVAAGAAAPVAGAVAGAAAPPAAAAGAKKLPSLARRVGLRVGKAWRGGKGVVKKAADWSASKLGPKVMEAAGKGKGKLGAGLALELTGQGMDLLADQIEEDELSFWKTLGRESLKSLGKGFKVGGGTLSSAQMGATAGTIAGGGPWGTAAGAVIGGGAGAYAGYQEQYGAGAVAQEAEEKEARDRIRRAREIQAKKEAQEQEILQALTDFKTSVSEFPAQFERLAGEIGELPEVISANVAKSRVGAAQESTDPRLMRGYVEKTTTAFQTAADKAGELKNTQMAAVEKRAQEMEKRAALEKQKDPHSGMEKRYLDMAKGIRTEKERISLDYQAELKKHDLSETAANVMQGVETQKGQRGRELQAKTMEFETGYAGTGNIEKMKEIQDETNAVNEANLASQQEGNATAVAALETQRKKFQIEVDESTVGSEAWETAKYNVELMDNRLREQKRMNDIAEKQLKQENQAYNIQQSITQAMAATETITFKRSQRAMALAKAQESFARERGGGSEEIGAYAGAQAEEAKVQLSGFMDTFDARMADLQQKLNAPGVTDVKRMALEMRIKDLADERVKLESQSLQSRIHAATAEERQRQELIGVNKRVADIQRDTAAKMGMSWQVQMKYQSDSIRLSKEDIDSTRKEITQMAAEIANTPGSDPAKQLQLQQRKADLAQKEADLISNVMGKQRSFMESAIANAFGIGGGTKVSPLVNQRLFGPQIQNQLGQRQAVGFGGKAPTFEEQQAKRLKDAGGGIFGGIGGGVPGPGNAPGLPPGVQLPGKPGAPGAGAAGGVGAGAAGGAGAGGAAGAQGAQQGAGAVDISGKIEIGLKDNMLETRVISIVQRNFGLPGGKGG